MDYVNIKEHLDKIVDELEELKTLEDYNSQIRFDLNKNFDNHSVMLYEGIDIVASAIGVGLFTKNIKSKEFDFEAYFEYRGYRFFQFFRNGELDVNV